MLHFKVFAFNPFQENTYLVWDDQLKAAIIDPGCSSDLEEKELEQFIEDNELQVEKVLLTHSHIDHVLGLKFCQDRWKLDAFNHPEDRETFASIPSYAPSYGIPYQEGKTPISELQDGETVSIGAEKMLIRFAPGHAPGHVVFIYENGGWIIGGDVLFQGSIGRTDLPGGSFEVLEASIQNVLYSYPPDFRVFPGHGPETTIGFEKSNNPFVKG